MNVRKFIAANARDALRKVKETLGNDAIILSNRGVPGGVAIMAVAARDMAMIVPTPVSSEPPPMAERRPVAPPPQAAPAADDDYRVLLSSARARVSSGQAPKISPPPPPFARPPPAAQPAAITSLVGIVLRVDAVNRDVQR